LRSRGHRRFHCRALQPSASCSMARQDVATLRVQNEQLRLDLSAAQSTGTACPSCRALAVGLAHCDLHWICPRIRAPHPCRPGLDHICAGTSAPCAGTCAHLRRDARRLLLRSRPRCCAPLLHGMPPPWDARPGGVPIPCRTEPTPHGYHAARDIYRAPCSRRGGDRARSLFCVASRLFCVATRLYCVATRLYCVATRHAAGAEETARAAAEQLSLEVEALRAELTRQTREQVPHTRRSPRDMACHAARHSYVRQRMGQAAMRAASDARA
jgi:hypothetical protein